MKLPIFSTILWKYARWYNKTHRHRFLYDPSQHYMGMGIKKRIGYIPKKKKNTETDIA